MLHPSLVCHYGLWDQDLLGKSKRTNTTRHTILTHVHTYLDFISSPLGTSHWPLPPKLLSFPSIYFMSLRLCGVVSSISLEKWWDWNTLQWNEAWNKSHFCRPDAPVAILNFGADVQKLTAAICLWEPKLHALKNKECSKNVLSSSKDMFLEVFSFF